MNEQDDGSLGLDEVVRRFADSEEALSRIREKLETLATVEATQSAAAEGLRGASESITELVVTARSIIEEAQATQGTARSVLEAGAGLIDGTDLKAIQGGVASTTNAVKEGFERIEKLLGEVQERDKKIAELEGELATRTGALTGRQRKRLGIE
jgi:peptidoglycan hydrolase CwlO-like protein